MTQNPALDVLYDFLHCSYDSQDVFDKFLALHGASDVYHQSQEDSSARFWYRPPTRKDAVLLVAHADVCEPPYYATCRYTKFKVADGMIMNNNPEAVLGGDDRCGCALLWLLRDSGHALLVTDGEENGLKGARELLNRRPDVMERINDSCRFFIELDRFGAGQYKFYTDVPQEFQDYISGVTGWAVDRECGATDIAAICTKRPGVNLAVGYDNHHTTSESISQESWLETLALLNTWLQQPIPEFTVA